MPSNTRQSCIPRYIRYLGIRTRDLVCLGLPVATLNELSRLDVSPHNQFVSVVELANALSWPSRRAIVATLFKAGIQNAQPRRDFELLFSDFPSAFSQIELLLAMDSDLQRALFLSLYQPKSGNPYWGITHIFSTLSNFDTGLLGGIFLGYLGSVNPKLVASSVENMRWNLGKNVKYLGHVSESHIKIQRVQLKYFSSELSARFYMSQHGLHSNTALVVQGQHYQLEPLKKPFWGVTLLVQGDGATVIGSAHTGYERQKAQHEKDKKEKEVRLKVDALFKSIKDVKEDQNKFYAVIDHILILDPKYYRAYAAKGYYMGINSEHDEAGRGEFLEAKRLFRVALDGWAQLEREDPTYFLNNPEEARWYRDMQETWERIIEKSKNSNHLSPE